MVTRSRPFRFRPPPTAGLNSPAFARTQSANRLRRPPGQTLHVIGDLSHAAFADRAVSPHDKRDESLRQYPPASARPQRLVVEMDDLDVRPEHLVEDGDLRVDGHAPPAR